MPAFQGHILIVEPNAITRKLIVGILNSKGFSTYEAAGGDEALGFLAKAPALVVLDVDGEDPGIIGFLRKVQMEHSRLPLVAMSDQEDKDALKARLALKEMSVLQKPVMPDHLLTNIENHLLKGVTAEVAAPAKPAAPETSPAAKEQRAGFMRRAVDLAQEKMDANCGGPFGAVVVRAGKIIGEGWDAVVSDKDPTAHAEIMAIRNAAKTAGDYNLEGCEIYTSCEPCPMCLAAIYWAHIDRLWYANTREDAGGIGFDTDFIYREIAQPEHKRALPSKMLLRDEGQIVFANWMKKGDKTVY